MCVNRLRSMLDKAAPVKKFVDALQQLTNPEMLFRVMSSTMNEPSCHLLVISPSLIIVI